MTSTRSDRPQPAALDRIRGTFSDLEAWGTRVCNPHMPAAGSALAMDDREAIGWQTSQLAVAGMGAARNHLHAIRVHIDAGEMFAEVTGTLIRGALLGAAQAVWVLSPEDRDVRLMRSRVVTVEVLENHRKFLVELLQVSPGHDDTRTVHEHVSQRLAEVKARRTDLGETMAYSNTALIEQAAAATFGAAHRAEARAEWRRFSGNAHGLPWAVLGVSGTQQTTPGDIEGMATFVAGGAFEDVLNGYLLAHGLCRRGWELLDRRSGA